MNKEGGVAVKKKVAIITTVVMLLVLVFLSVGIAYRLSKSDSSQDFSSKELVVRSTDSEVIKGYSSKETIGDLTVFKFKSEEEARKAYVKSSVLIGSENIEVNSYLSTYLDEDEVEAVTRVTSEETELKKYLDSEYEKENYSDVTVAVIDTGLNLGVDYTHRVIGYENRDTFKDEHGHGTKIAMTIFETSPDNVKVLPIKVTDKDGRAKISDVYNGIKKAIEADVNVINISMGTYTSANSNMLAEVIKEATEKNIAVVVAAGNASTDASNYTPASVKEAYTVSAVDYNNNLASFSNYGNVVDYSTYGVDGTSVASANISSIIAQILGINEGYSLSDLNKILDKYSVDLGEKGKDISFGNGLLSLYKYSIPTDTGDKGNAKANKTIREYWGNSNWKDLSNDYFNDILFFSSPEDNGKFLTELSDEDFDLAVSKSEYLRNTTEITSVDEQENVTKRYKKCYDHCIDAFESATENLSVYANENYTPNTAATFSKDSAIVYVAIYDEPNEEIYSDNKIELRGATNPADGSSMGLKAHTIWLNGGRALTGMTLANTLRTDDGKTVHMDIDKDTIHPHSFGIKLDEKTIDNYDEETYVRQAGVTFHIKYDKPDNFIFSSTENCYPDGSFAKLEHIATNNKVMHDHSDVYIWKYSNDATSHSGTEDSVFNLDKPKGICVSVDIQRLMEYSSDEEPTLYINYTRTSYTIQFNKNGGSGSMDNQTKYHGVNKTLRGLDFSKTGYTFEHWNTDSKDSSEGDTYNNKGTYKNNEDVTLYAIWKANKYKLNFDYNAPCEHNNNNCASITGGDTTFKEVTYDSKIGDLPSPSKAGYTFQGWYTAKTGGSQWTKDTIYQVDGDSTLYARWKANTYTITFNKGATDYNDKEAGVAPLGCTWDVNVTFPSHNPLTGRSYKIEFSSNRGTGSTIPQPAPATATGNLPFTHWSLSGNRTEGTEYERPNFAGKSKDKDTTTATAQWGTVTLDYSDVVLSRTGYTFGGLYESDGTKTQAFTISGATTAYQKTLTAKWTPNQYNLNFDYNKPSVASCQLGNSDTASIKVTFDSAVANLPQPTLEGWVFKGWKLIDATKWYSTADDFPWNEVSTLKETLIIDNNYIWRTAGDLTAIAQWEPLTYSVSYKSGGGTVGKKDTDVPNDDVSLVVDPSHVYTVKYVYDNAYDYLPDDKKAEITKGYPVLFTNYFQGSGEKTTSSLTNHTSYFDKRYIVNFYESPNYTPMTYLKDNNVECNYWDFSKWKCEGSSYITAGDEFNEGYDFGSNKSGKYKNLTNVRDGVVTFTGTWREEGITLPAVDLDLHRFLGWFTNSQVATETPDANGSLNFGDRGIYYGGGLTWNYDKLNINYTRSDGKSTIEQDTSLYSWWNKYPSYTDIYDGIFYEGQNITYSNLLELVGSLDYEDDYYNTVKTQLEKLVVKEDNDDNDSDKNDGNIHEEDITTQEMTSEEVQALIKDIDTSCLTIKIDKIKYVTETVDTTGVDLSNYPLNYLNTSTYNIGDLVITYTVTDNGIIAGTDFDSEQITLTYEKACEIKYNNAPALSVSDVMLFTTDNTTKDNIGEYLISRQIAVDAEDMIDNIPWWCKDNAKTALNMDTARKLNDTIFIVNTDNVTVNSAFENKYKEASDWLKSLVGLETIYGLKTSSAVHTFDGVSFRESELFEQITGMDVEFDCYDQFGKHASGNITPDNYKGGQEVDEVPTPIPNPGDGGSGNPTPTPNGGGGNGGSGNPTPTPNGGGSGNPTPTPNPGGDEPKCQPEDSRKIKVILINIQTDSTMLGANTATIARYISGGFMGTLDVDSYYSSVDGGRNVLLGAFDIGKKSNLNNMSPSSTDVVYYNNKFTNSIGKDKVRVNINDYTN